MPLGGADWYKEQPTNRNFLNPIGFILELEKFDGVDFFCQSANMPRNKLWLVKKKLQR